MQPSETCAAFEFAKETFHDYFECEGGRRGVFQAVTPLAMSVLPGSLAAPSGFGRTGIADALC